MTHIEGETELSTIRSALEIKGIPGTAQAIPGILYPFAG